ncbi:hypothetical protein ABFC59_07345 [Enterobacter hormaechei]|uniref:hypothetical protein n=1 Tax=Enterobacterales TaxID=91347 RepID=UPI0018D7D168|nr:MULTISPECIES: hypothetical protein [Enterobacterales]EKZ6361115.1 hypothetical protein [Klebsiella aerogenes]MBH2617033.1 hypothetical protein [Serratia ureilytica]MDU3159018.1 hypothetical protein [Hafnia alvei]HCR0321697.1 hypothetical protein [Klebsiella aerogenes]
MKRLSIFTMLLFPVTSFAVPNMWASGFGQGITEYLITNPENVVFNLNCTMNPDEQNILQHNVLIDLPDGTRADSHDDKTAIMIVTDDQQFPLPSSLGWRNGDNAWIQFIDALGNAATFDVYVNDKKVGHFSPGIKNTKKELEDLSGCRNTAG